MSHQVGRKSQISNREYELDNHCTETIGAMDRWSKSGLQSVYHVQVRFEGLINEADKFYRLFN